MNLNSVLKQIDLKKGNIYAGLDDDINDWLIDQAIKHRVSTIAAVIQKLIVAEYIKDKTK